MKSQSDDLGKCCRTISDLCVTRLDVSEREREKLRFLHCNFVLAAKEREGQSICLNTLHMFDSV